MRKRRFLYIYYPLLFFFFFFALTDYVHRFTSASVGF